MDNFFKLLRLSYFIYMCTKKFFFFVQRNFDRQKIQLVKYSRTFKVDFWNPRTFVWFDGPKIDLIFMYFLWSNFNGQKIVFRSKYVLRSNSDGRNVNVSMHYFHAILRGWKLTKLWHALCDAFLKGKGW